jgi:hypothetical protein
MRLWHVACIADSVTSSWLTLLNIYHFQLRRHPHLEVWPVECLTFLQVVTVTTSWSFIMDGPGRLRLTRPDGMPGAAVQPVHWKLALCVLPATSRTCAAVTANLSSMRRDHDFRAALIIM